MIGKAGKGKGKGGGDFHHCGEKGHFKRECPKLWGKGGKGGTKGSGKGMGEVEGSGKGMGFQGSCYTCGKPGHTSRECWAKGAGKGKGGGYGPASSGKGSARTLDEFWQGQVQPLSALRAKETPVKNRFKALAEEEEEEDAEAEPVKSGRCQSKGSPRYDPRRVRAKGQALGSTPWAPPQAYGHPSADSDVRALLGSSGVKKMGKGYEGNSVDQRR